MFKKLLIPILLAGLMVAGFYLRFNKVFETSIYNGDEGRDYLQAYRIWQEDFTLLGPAISTVRFYLPPTWFYLVSIPLKLGNWQIEAPLLFIILTHTLTILLFYLLGKEAGNKFTGLISASLFALSPYMIKASRLTGNHIMIPCLIALYLLFLVRFLKYKHKFDLLISSIILGFAFSFHFSIVILIIFQLGVLVLNWIKQKQINFKTLLLNSGFLFIWWLPIVAFDLRHGFINFNGFWWYLTQGNVNELRQEIGQGSWSIANNLKAGLKILKQHLTFGNFLPRLYLPLSLIGWIFVFIDKNKKKIKLALPMLIFILLFIFNFLFYKGYIAYHFFFALFPFYVLLLSIGLSKLINKNILLLILFILLITPFNLFSPQAYANSPKRVLKVKQVSNLIADDLNNSPGINTYSIFLKKKQDFWALAQEYKYLVETKTNEQLAPNEHYEQAQVLYFVAEIPVENPMAVGNIEIRDFNPKKIIWEKEVEDYTIFKLE